MNEILKNKLAVETADSLRQSEEIFRLMIDSVQDYAIFLLDPQGHVMTWNRGAQRLKGYSADEIIGSHFSRFYTEEDIAKAKPAVELKVAEENGRVQDIGWRLRKDGSRFWANVTITALTDKEGNLRGFSKVTRDMTDQRLADEVLRQSEERLRLMIESVQDYAIFMMDPKGYITSWNVGAERINGYKANEIIGKHFSVFYIEEDIVNKKPSRELVSATETGRYAEEGWRLRKDGSRFWSSVVITAVRDKTGELKGFAKVTRDITDRKFAEDALEKKVIDRTADLLRMNKELGQFAYVASHDLQEPLRMVAMYVDLLNARLENKLNEDEKQFMKYAVEGSERAQSLIRDLLEYSQVGSKEKKFNTVDMNQAAGKALDNLKLSIEEIKPEIKVDPLPPVKGDPLQMSQLFQNLISNAVKYRSSERLKIKISFREEDDCFIFSVEDNGIGIAPEHYERIFELFQRLHSREEYSGSGLGLAICKKIVERHGGWINVESKPGKGTTFKFMIPKDYNE